MLVLFAKPLFRDFAAKAPGGDAKGAKGKFAFASLRKNSIRVFQKNYNEKSLLSLSLPLISLSRIMDSKLSGLYSLSYQTGIELYAIKMLAEETNSEPQHLKTHFSPIIYSDDPNREYGKVPQGKIVLVPGICFPVLSKGVGREIVERVRPQVELKGYKLFLCDGNSREDNCGLAIVKCDDEFTPLVYMRTNGVNFDVNTHQLILHLSELSKELDLKLIGADFDWCEFEIRQEPKDWVGLARTIGEFCPDIIYQGAQSIEQLAEVMRERKVLYYWFD